MTDAERAELAREIALAVSGGESGHICACGVPADSAPEGTHANGLAHALDLSLPRPDATQAEVERFLEAARRAQFRSVCVSPDGLRWQCARWPAPVREWLHTWVIPMAQR